MAIAVLGRGLGAVIYPLFLQFLFDYYAYTGTFLIIGACFLQGVPLGALLRPPDKGQHKKQDAKPKDLKMTDWQAAGDLLEKVEIEKEEDKKEHKPPLWTRIIKAIDLTLLKEPVVLAYLSHTTVVAIPMTIVATYAASLADELGLSKQEAAWSISAYGIAIVVATVTAGIVFDMKIVRKHIYQVYAVHVLLLGVLLLFTPTLNGEVAPFVVFSVVLGALMGVLLNERMVVLSHLVPVSRYPSAVGLCTCFSGVGMFLGPVLGG